MSMQPKKPNDMLKPDVDLRDYFAAKAMQALIHAKPHYSSGDIVSVSYSYADMMLHERVYGNY